MTDKLPFDAELRAWVKQTRELAERMPMVAEASKLTDTLHESADQIELLLDDATPEKSPGGEPPTGPRR